MGVSRSLAAKWKTAKTEKPSADVLMKMSEYFEMSIEEILEAETEKAPTPEGERQIGFDDFTYAMQNEAKDLPQEKKDMLLQMARFMKAEMEKDGGK